MSDRITIINDAYVIQSSISFHSISKFILKRKNSLLFFLPYAIMGKKKWAAASTARSSCCVSLAGLFLPFQQGFYFYLCFFNVLASVQDFKNLFRKVSSSKLFMSSMFFSFLTPAVLFSFVRVCPLL